MATITVVPTDPKEAAPPEAPDGPVTISDIAMSTDGVMELTDGVRREALEVRLKKAKQPERHKIETRREALEIKLHHRDHGPKTQEEVRREALEVQLRDAKLRGEVEKEEETKEAVEQIAKLQRVPSAQRGRSFHRARSSANELRRRASSLLEMGGLLPSMVKKVGSRAAKEGEEFVGFVADAHTQLKSALTREREEMRRLEAEMEAERKEAERRERARVLENHLKKRLEVHELEELRVERARKLAKDMQQLREVFDELLLTEATYLGDLNFVLMRYLLPLREMMSVRAALAPPPCEHCPSTV